jgi:hypothetical protein
VDLSWAMNSISSLCLPFSFPPFFIYSSFRREEIISKVERKVSPDMNEAFFDEYTEEEVDLTLNAVGDLKAPRPDGMLTIFF